MQDSKQLQEDYGCTCTWLVLGVCYKQMGIKVGVDAIGSSGVWALDGRWVFRCSLYLEGSEAGGLYLSI